MQLRFFSIPVRDQNAALDFYTRILGFEKMADIPMEGYRFLTVAAPGGIEGVQLALEAADFGPSKVYQQARFDAGIPALALNTENVRADVERLKKRGVVFRGEPKDEGPIIAVDFEDACGNLIKLVEAKPM